MGSNDKPLVVVGCTPFFGHMSPIRAIAKELIERGYEVTMVTSSHYKSFVEDVGATYAPILGYGDFYEGALDERWADRKNKTPGLEQLAYDYENAFIGATTSQHEAYQAALKRLNESHPGRPIVQVNEGAFSGAYPIMLGAQGIKPTGTLGIGIVPMYLSSIDLPAFGAGLPPDNSPEGRERNKAMVKSVYEGFLAPANKMFGEQVEKLGGSMPKAHIMDITYTAPDRFLQMCTPSVEYPRSDAPSSLRFAGGLPKGKRDAFINKPSWWNKVENPGAKKVVAVCQGSLALNYAELTIPSIEALKDRQDITLVVALGKKGASLPNDISIPSNTLIADFIPFDDLLPLCSVFISNGGYGGFQHAISNATPLIIAGATEDKPEVAARAEWAGIGVNLKTGTPTPKAIREAVDQVLGDVKYKKRAEELQEEMKEFDPIGEVARNIDELGKLQ